MTLIQQLYHLANRVSTKIVEERRVKGIHISGKQQIAVRNGILLLSQCTSEIAKYKHSKLDVQTQTVPVRIQDQSSHPVFKPETHKGRNLNLKTRTDKRSLLHILKFKKSQLAHKGQKFKHHYQEIFHKNKHEYTKIKKQASDNFFEEQPVSDSLMVQRQKKYQQGDISMINQVNNEMMQSKSVTEPRQSVQEMQNDEIEATKILAKLKKDFKDYVRGQEIRNFFTLVIGSTITIFLTGCGIVVSGILSVAGAAFSSLITSIGALAGELGPLAGRVANVLRQFYRFVSTQGGEVLRLLKDAILSFLQTLKNGFSGMSTAASEAESSEEAVERLANVIQNIEPEIVEEGSLGAETEESLQQLAEVAEEEISTGVRGTQLRRPTRAFQLEEEVKVARNAGDFQGSVLQQTDLIKQSSQLQNSMHNILDTFRQGNVFNATVGLGSMNVVNQNLVAAQSQEDEEFKEIMQEIMEDQDMSPQEIEQLSAMYRLGAHVDPSHMTEGNVQFVQSAITNLNAFQDDQQQNQQHSTMFREHLAIIGDEALGNNALMLQYHNQLYRDASFAQQHVQQDDYETFQRAQEQTRQEENRQDQMSNISQLRPGQQIGTSQFSHQPSRYQHPLLSYVQPDNPFAQSSLGGYLQ